MGTEESKSSDIASSVIATPYLIRGKQSQNGIVIPAKYMRGQAKRSAFAMTGKNAE